jgi:autotransporter adhesin
MPHPDDPTGLGFMGIPALTPEGLRKGSMEGNRCSRLRDGYPHPDDPYHFGFHGDHGEMKAVIDKKISADYHRARFGEGKSIKDALAVALAGTHLAGTRVTAAHVTELEEAEAANPDAIAREREKWEAIVKEAA